MGKGRTISNAEHEAQIGLIKQIDVEQNFANQAYADLASIIGATGTFTECFTSNSKLWTITHNLGKYPSVTIVDDNNEVVIGAIDYKSTNQVAVSFNSPFDGCAFLN